VRSKNAPEERETRKNAGCRKDKIGKSENRGNLWMRAGARSEVIDQAVASDLTHFANSAAVARFPDLEFFHFLRFRSAPFVVGCEA
jgi:hypothetical protein